MGHDEMTVTLLADYKATAENLQKGVNVTAETMNRYHGMTGTLLATCVTQLWSQAELDKTIDERQEARCRSCPNTQTVNAWKAQQSQDDAAGVKLQGMAPKCLAFVHALTPYRWPMAIAVFSPFAGDVVTKVIAVFK